DVYVALDVPVRSARNPMQRYYFPRASPVPGGCRTRVVTGRVKSVDPYYGIIALTGHHRLSTAADTRFLTPTVDGVPRLAVGVRVKVNARACQGRKLLVAHTITQS